MKTFFHFIAPREVITCKIPIRILKFRHYKGICELDRRRYVQTHCTFGAFLGINQDNAIGGIGSIQCGSRRTRQYG